MIHVEQVYKTFKLYDSPADRLKELFLRRRYHRVFEALKGISFEVASGRTLGIIGQNGAGKSTILKILTGVLLADSGTIHVDGKITGLLELGTGFNVEFTGLQNIYMNGTLLGMSRAEIDRKMDRILDFSELGAFIKEPIKTYSSGMMMRLAFSIAIHAEPQAFVVDEALSVGDAYFQQKCMNKIKAFKNDGGAIIFVSHDTNAVKVLCDQAMLLDHGQVIEFGDPEEVINTYNFLLAKKAKGEEIRVVSMEEEGSSYGNFKVKILDVELSNEAGAATAIFVSGEACRIGIRLSAEEAVDEIIVGVLIRDRFGQDIFGTNTHHLRKPLAMAAGQMCEVIYEIGELNIGPGKYTLTVAAHRQETHVEECYQWVDAIKSFEVVSARDFAFVGLAKLKPSVQVEWL